MKFVLTTSSYRSFRVVNTSKTLLQNVLGVQSAAPESTRSQLYCFRRLSAQSMCVMRSFLEISEEISLQTAAIVALLAPKKDL